MMTPTTKSMKLFATWERGQNPAFNDPTEIRWENGQRATLADYMGHLDDTFVFTIQGGSFVRIAFPDVIADVRFDESLGRWVCQVPGQPRVIMELSDRDIGDAQMYPSEQPQS